MELKQLETFAAVVKTGSFTKAAEKLYISQPTISIRVRSLEEELDTQLIVRTTKRIEITQRGYELYEFAKQVLELRDDLLKRWDEEEGGVIRLGASAIPAAYVLPELLANFREKHSEIRFAIQQDDSWSIVEGVRNGAFDIGLTGMDIKDAMLQCAPFCQDRMVLITPVNERFSAMKDGGYFPPELLRGEQFILRKKGGKARNSDRLLEELGIVGKDLHVAAWANDQESIKNLVANGLGVSVVSERAARSFVQAGRLLEFELPDCRTERSLYVVVRRGCVLKENIQRFIHYLLMSDVE